LILMVDGHQTAAWNHTCSIIAKIHNVNCTKKGDLIRPQDIHPLLNKNRDKTIHTTDLSVLKPHLKHKDGGK